MIKMAIIALPVTYKKYEAAKGVIVSTGYHGRAQDMMMEIGVEEAMYTLRNGEEFPASSGFGGSGMNRPI